ncbi:protease HtpX [Candidatus Palibaumannia cicadellinicola]|uniref:Protease HtpX n=1 Tax=Baumannia cicadellinicola subsp. Homalodisca coagulata TaxID=374463 RepID=HTPX_BAUCH|nr:protease HtpX [Candidatus Baumannia cicadellinicola]Q1LTF8.1 RecName: Full=Protease HtpX; AltName: Full=Heat shock protein HtpX [Baumannia cicadellinicola str. Hc (Homalodisca coagulata)]ABF14002.1 heat shock protein, integral membrane protein [Baumannia cicadellinicola str. Hc (Homalodisca coagulata)]MBS0032736.1 protease HtpX [Candidatus Baumannia cicadellinicola]MCJ7462261.1 protease HtpX [Candidatus Baumannia cicadellinicola]MCJ7462557.1 protease HtpX [Candidatus Baumannia cicadellinico
MMRIVIFLLTNLAVMVVFGILLTCVGTHSSNTVRLMIISGLFGFCGAFISLLMSKFIALRSVGGKVISQPQNETEHWLLNIILNQAQKIGITMPQVAIYNAPDMNAFATGPSRNNSLVAVSTGLLQNMPRTEIEAVIAHEISHISNGDMVTITLISGIVNTFVIFISRFLAQLTAGFIGSNNEESNNGNKLVYMIVSTILELAFGILASIIVLWFSRYREFYADAGSANIVGCDKMIAALQRLKTSYEPKVTNNIKIFCINGYQKSLSEFFMSHPPLNKRIEALRYGTYMK